MRLASQPRPPDGNPRLLIGAPPGLRDSVAWMGGWEAFSLGAGGREGLEGLGRLLIIAGAVFLFLMMRRRKSAKPDNEKSELPGGGYYASEKNKELSGDYHRGASVDTTGRKSELSPDGQINELENNNDYNGTINRGSTNLSEMGPNTPHPGR